MRCGTCEKWVHCECCGPILADECQDCQLGRFHSFWPSGHSPEDLANQAAAASNIIGPSPSGFAPHNQSYTTAPGGGERRQPGDTDFNAGEGGNAIPDITESDIAERSTSLGIQVTLPTTWLAERRLQRMPTTRRLLFQHYTTLILLRLSGDLYTPSRPRRRKQHKRL